MKTKPLWRLSLFLVAFLLSLSILLSISPAAFASPSGDLGSEQGGWAAGDQNNKVIKEVDAVRLTAISATDGSVQSISIDWANIDPEVQTGKKAWHFGKVCKQKYNINSELKWQRSGYDFKAPPAGFPIIIDTNGVSHIDEIRNYFIKDRTVKCFCADVYGFTPSVSADGNVDISGSVKAQELYDRFKNGDYVLAIEPVAFFLWGGQLYGGTATEIALLAKETDPQHTADKTDLFHVIGNLTHRNAPNALYLEQCHPNLGYPNPKPRLDRNYGQHYYDNTIIDSCLGIGMVWFTPPAPKVYYHVYTSTRTPTDKSLTELTTLPLADQLKHSKQVDDKSSWKCINPSGSTPTYEKITQPNGTQVELYYATKDTTLATLLADHQLTSNGTPCAPPIIGVEALEKAVDKTHLDPYPGANILHQYPGTGINLADPKALKYKESDQGLGKKKDGKEERSTVVTDEMFEHRVLIATSVLDCGTTISAENVKHVVVNSIDPVTTMQFVGRVRRKGSNFNLYFNARSNADIWRRFTDLDNKINLVKRVTDNNNGKALSENMDGVASLLSSRWIYYTDNRELVPNNLGLRKACSLRAYLADILADSRVYDDNTFLVHQLNLFGLNPDDCDNLNKDKRQRSVSKIVAVIDPISNKELTTEDYQAFCSELDSILVEEFGSTTIRGSGIHKPETYNNIFEEHMIPYEVLKDDGKRGEAHYMFTKVEDDAANSGDTAAANDMTESAS